MAAGRVVSVVSRCRVWPNSGIEARANRLRRVAREGYPSVPTRFSERRGGYPCICGSAGGGRCLPSGGVAAAFEAPAVSGGGSPLLGRRGLHSRRLLGRRQASVKTS